MTVGAGLDSIPMPITPGREMAALARFHTDVTWTGSIQAGGMGPGTPAMTAVGWGKHETIQDGRWIVGTYQQDQFLADTTFVLTWQLHWVAGWVPPPASTGPRSRTTTGAPTSCAGGSRPTASPSRQSVTARFASASSGTAATRPR